MTTPIPSIFELPLAQHELSVPGAGEKQQNLVARAALAAVCRHWKITPQEIYGDRRDPNSRQARTAICLLLSGNTTWTRHQIARFIGRRTPFRITRDIAAASQWPNMDQHYPTRLSRAERDLKKNLAELVSPLAAEAGTAAPPVAAAPSPLEGEGGPQGRVRGDQQSAEGGAA